MPKLQQHSCQKVVYKNITLIVAFCAFFATLKKVSATFNIDSQSGLQLLLQTVSIALFCATLLAKVTLLLLPSFYCNKATSENIICKTSGGTELSQEYTKMVQH
jgi:hypothetical protein